MRRALIRRPLAVTRLCSLVSVLVLCASAVLSTFVLLQKAYSVDFHLDCTGTLNNCEPIPEAATKVPDEYTCISVYRLRDRERLS